MYYDLNLMKINKSDIYYPPYASFSSLIYEAEYYDLVIEDRRYHY